MTEKAKNYLDIFTLSCLAVAHPLFDLLAQNAEFFVARGSKPVDLFLMIAVLGFVLPLPLVLGEMLAGRINSKLETWLHRTFIGLLAGIILLPIFKQMGALPGWALIVLSALLGAGFAFLYARLQPVNLFVKFLSPILVLSPAYFLMNPAIAQVAFPSQPTLTTESGFEARHPIFMLVFDELPLVSLLDQNNQIDPVRYPNFHKLSKKAYWFSNAVTVAEGTTNSISAILSGLYPDQPRLPNSQGYPRNLFTLLGGSYPMSVKEINTKLCPSQFCGEDRPKQVFRVSLYSLLLDLGVIYSHQVLPKNLTRNLPNISLSWKDFLGQDNAVPIPSTKTQTEDVIEKLRPSHITGTIPQYYYEFLAGIENHSKPGFYYLHVMLPHAPWIYLPSGRHYTFAEHTNLNIEGLYQSTWGADKWATVQGYQRHLLQVGFVDTLLGEFVSRLKSKDLFDQSLLIVLADHGANFQPGDRRREITETNFQDILPIPLFIKSPGQKEGQKIEKNIETVDILPTLADILEINLPFETDGHSALSSDFPKKKTAKAYKDYKNQEMKFSFSEIQNKVKSAVRKKKSLFGASDDPLSLYRIGRYGNLVGKDAADFLKPVSSDVRIRLDYAESAFDSIDPADPFVPVQVGGRIEVPEKLEKPLYLAVSVNGEIKAVTRTYPKDQKPEYFTSMVPDSSYRSKNNNVEIFLVEEDEFGNINLLRTSEKEIRLYTLSTDESGRKRVTDSQGTLYTLDGDNLRGRLDRVNIKKDSVSLSGWAVDYFKRSPPEEILVFLGDEFYYSGRTVHERQDVAAAFSGPGFLKTGFNFQFPLKDLDSPAKPPIRMFLISKDNRVAEISYPPPGNSRSLDRWVKNPTLLSQKTVIEYTQTNLINEHWELNCRAPQETLHLNKERIYRIIPNSMQGHLKAILDRAELHDEFLYMNGWSASPKLSQVPEGILIFLNGELLHFGTPWIPRQDVVEYFGKDSSLRLSGFEFRFPLKLFNNLEQSDLRAFALWRNGLASEFFYPKNYPWKHPGNCPPPPDKPKQLYQLQRDGDGQEFIVGSNKQRIPLLQGKPKSLRGFVEKAEIVDSKLILSGHAENLDNTNSSNSILVFENGKSLYSGWTGLPRPDVAGFYNNEALEFSGFRFEFPVSWFENLPNSKIRVFIINSNKEAKELWYSADYPWN